MGDKREDKIEDKTGRVHLIVSGRVQGVWFRYNTSRVANELGLTGFVRNLPNGDVEVTAEGDATNLRKLVEFCKRGPEGAFVEDVKIEYEQLKRDFSSFSIR